VFFRRFVVTALERLCTLTGHRLFACRLADLSARLDERWDTRVWQPIIETPFD
jgi:hypothetical protein